MHLLDLRIDDIAPSEILDRIYEAVERKERLLIVNANAHLVLLSRKHWWLRHLFEIAQIAFCDGAGVQFALWLKTGKKPSRSTPPQWIEEMGHKLGGRDARVYWLGGELRAVARAAINFSDLTGMRIAGWHDGYFDDSRKDLVEEINRTKPDVLLVCMGMPLQEQWVYHNHERLRVPVIITAGALVDHAAGLRKRPPMWVADLGLEWIVRLVIEPRRLWRRYVLGLPVFATLALREALLTRLSKFRSD